METWLNSNIPDSAMELTGCTLFHADGTSNAGKKVGGGLCIYLNNARYTNAAIMDKLCTPHLEYTVVRCRPFYLPREYSMVLVIAVYIPPNANVKLVLELFYTAISKLVS